MVVQAKPGDISGRGSFHIKTENELFIELLELISGADPVQLIANALDLVDTRAMGQVKA